MKYMIHVSINNMKLSPYQETINEINLFAGKLKFFTEVGYIIHRIERVE